LSGNRQIKKIHDKIFPEHIPGHITCPEDYYLEKREWVNT